MDVMEFFRVSAGKWRSQRTTHHLAFKRFEKGESDIEVSALSADHPKVLEICELHQVDPSLAVGGAYVAWFGTMEWDRDTEGGHEGSTVFVLVPDADNPTEGRLLRDKGYAEIVPVVGHYRMDGAELVLTTEYETMSSKERFWFADRNLRFRSSSLKRFGGFSSTTFCSEARILDSEGNDCALAVADSPAAPSDRTAANVGRSYSAFGW
jgi:hypothetical protein